MNKRGGVAVAAVLLAACAGPTYREVQASEPYDFTSLEQMMATSELVVLGTVEDVRLGRIAGAGTEGEFQILDVILRVERVLWGQEDSELLVVEEDGWELDDKDQIPMAVNGLLPSEKGDRGVYFLVQGGTGYQYVGSQGRFLESGNHLEGSDYEGDQWSADVQAWNLDRLIAQIRDAGDAIKAGQVSPASPKTG
jgi:hypothetical protein